MEKIRKPFQGIRNIVRFNWHFYFFSMLVVLVIFFFRNYADQRYQLLAELFCVIIIATTLVSLIVSFVVYDLSGLYTLNWLDKAGVVAGSKMVNINAGFDETSMLLKYKYPGTQLTAFDFYDPIKHTEISIKRARKAYPPQQGIIHVKTSSLPLQDGFADNVFVIFAAHEIRNDAERTVFFKELNRVTRDSGCIIITEHLRNVPNFLAYNIGFLHFHSRATWKNNFKNANLQISNEIRITAFITTFILKKNAASS